MQDPAFMAFDTAAGLDAWLRAHHASQSELWLRIFHKASGIPSITWAECVETCLIWGWIDGHKRSLDSQSYVQRITPRRRNSNWSARNIGIAEALIAAARMQPSGLTRVEEARENGKWGGVQYQVGWRTV